MEVLFSYFPNHASYELFDIVDFIKIQNCPTRSSCINQFKLFIVSVSENKTDNTIYKKAQKFAAQVRLDRFDILEQRNFNE